MQASPSAANSGDTAKARPTTGVAMALLLCFVAGAFLQAAFALAHNLSGRALFTPAATIQRSLEVGLAATFVAALSAAIWFPLVRLRQSPSGTLGALMGAAGLLACLWILGGFWIAPPARDAIYETVDPLRLRLLSLVGAAVVCFLLLWPARAFMARTRWTHVTALSALCVICLGLAAWTSAPASTEPARELHMISVDTLRADRLGCYGHDAGTSPNLDRLCTESVVFERAFTPVPETIPSYASILSGKHPVEHKLYNNYLKLDDAVETIPERLQEAGYLTVAILEGSFPGTFANLDQGFDVVIQRGIVAFSPAFSPHDAISSLAYAVRSELGTRLRWSDSVTAAAAERWLEQLGAERPLFTHVYWPYPHGPYTPPPRHQHAVDATQGPPEDIAAMRHRYDGEIHFTDALLGQVLEALAARPGSANALWLFTADHGEELGRIAGSESEPFFGHSRYLNDSSSHVPLLVRTPADSGMLPGRRTQLVQTPSIAATLLAAAGLDPGPGLAPPLPLEPESEGAGHVFAIMRSGKLNRVGVRDASDFLLVETRAPERALELFHYSEGHEESLDPGSQPAVTQRLRTRLREVFPSAADSDAPDAPALSERQVDVLRSLGYVQ